MKSLFWFSILVTFLVEFQTCLSVPQHTSITNILNYDPKIVGGELATFNGTKHVVSIRLKYAESKYGFGYGHICGGSLISSKVVLTASHCFLNLDNPNNPTMRTADEFTLVMGTLIRTKKDNSFQTSVKQIIPHKDFSIYTLENDIAIMILENEAPNNTVIQPISLAENNVAVGTKCRIDGWGALGSGLPGTAELLTVNITTISNDQCRTSYKDKLKNGMFCAGDWNGGKDSCQGDSGGPLSCDGKLVGVVSWGEQCAKPKYPGIYSDVVYFKDWIKKNNSNMININTFFIIISIVISMLCYN